MRYISTRGGMAPQTFSDVLLMGLAPDGGLVVPEYYPKVSAEELSHWRFLSYPDLAFAVIQKFVGDDIPAATLQRIINKTYTADIFGHADITPLTVLAPGLHVLELSNGPTLAFKDMAMQLLGNLFEYVLMRSGRQLNILGATSGDTGSAAEYALRGKQGVRVFMLSPYGKMSRFQTAQMYSLQDPNIFNIAVQGVFDDCQDIVKAVSQDAVFKENYHIGTVNSINWARVVAQVVYYFKAYFAATRDDHSPVSFSVPSGNFGNVCAGHVARMMGLPIHKLIVATNENNVLDEFFRTGCYRPRESAETRHTSSPSMDISKASNFERFIFDLVGRDATQVKQWWQQVDRGISVDLAATHEYANIAEYGFVSGTSSHADRIATIRMVYECYGRIIDPHTADGVKVGLAYQERGIPLICLETALPVKFEATIQEALNHPPLRPMAFVGLEDEVQRFHVMSSDVDTIKRYIEQQIHAVES